MHKVYDEIALDEKFASVLSDVVWRFHVYDQYGKKQDKAVKTLAKRAPGYSAEFYKEQFETNLKLLMMTIAAVHKAPKSSKAGQKFSEYSDVDIQFVLNQLRLSFAEASDDFLKAHLGMVIYWYYLR
ncbi:MAG: hypothetical protein ABI986_07640 [Chloroflexota bacterium]